MVKILKSVTNGVLFLNKVLNSVNYNLGVGVEQYIRLNRHYKIKTTLGFPRGNFTEPLGSNIVVFKLLTMNNYLCFHNLEFEGFFIKFRKDVGDQHQSHDDSCRL